MPVVPNAQSRLEGEHVAALRVEFSPLAQIVQPIQLEEPLKSGVEVGGEHARPTLPGPSWASILRSTLTLTHRRKFLLRAAAVFSRRISGDVMFASDLNPSQQEAVNHIEGPLLVLAGPGSGKTRVIARRIVRLVESGVAPGQILAITFTNKAAGEMAARVAALLPGRQVWVSTFHKMCARLLRRDAAAVGLAPNFTIFDTADQGQIVRGVLTELEMDSQHYKPSAILHRISKAKYHLQSPEAFATAAQDRQGNRSRSARSKCRSILSIRISSHGRTRSISTTC